MIQTEKFEPPGNNLNPLEKKVNPLVLISTPREIFEPPFEDLPPLERYVGCPVKSDFADKGN